jgi:hypothetical protein
MHDHNNPAGTFLEVVARELKLSETEAGNAWNYLGDAGYIKRFSIQEAARITAAGIELISQAERSPNQPIPQFGSVTYNVTIFGATTNSQVNFGSPGSQQMIQSNSSDSDAVRQLEHFPIILGRIQS